MKTMRFYAGEKDVERIQAEQERLAAAGDGASETEAIRSLISRAMTATVQNKPAVRGPYNGNETLKFRVLPGGRTLYQRVEKVFVE